MSRYYPSSRGASRGRASYSYGSGSYSSRGGAGGASGGYSSAGYSSSRGGSSYGAPASGGAGYYQSRGAASGGSSSGQGRYYPDRDRRDSSSGAPSSHRAQLEIAKKLVDTLIQSSSGSRRPSEHYSSGAEPAYKRPRDESYDRDRSSSLRSRHSDYHYRRDDYPERRPRDDFHAPPTRRPFRARGYAPRRGTGYVPRGGPPRHYEGGESRDRSFEGRRDDAPRPTYPPNKQLVTKCPHCHARCATFADFRKHQLGRDHMSAMRRVLMKIRGELGKMRLTQREEQKTLEAAALVKDPEFESLPTQFCTLCRLQYREIEGVVHNETDWHRKQRAYQNPSCKTCNMNFPARIAYEKHTGTFTHIQKVNQSERRAERRDAADFQKGDFMTLDSVGDVDEEGSRARDQQAREDSDEPQLSATEKLADLVDYDGKHAVGSSYMRKTEVYHCGLCDIYIKITAKVNAVLIKHCMGKKHFENYRKKLTKLSEKEEEERKAAAEAEAEAEQEELPDDDAKTSQEDGDGDGEEAADTPKKPNGGEKTADCDPSDDAAAPAESKEEPQPSSRADDAAWEQMDDNFILGDDQEEEAAEKRTVGVTE